MQNLVFSTLGAGLILAAVPSTERCPRISRSFHIQWGGRVSTAAARVDSHRDRGADSSKWAKWVERRQRREEWQNSARERIRNKSLRQRRRKQESVVVTVEKIGKKAWQELKHRKMVERNEARSRLRSANLSTSPRIVIDLDYANSEGEIRSLAKQLRCAYHHVLYSENPPVFALSSYNDHVANVLAAHGSDNWVMEKYVEGLLHNGSYRVDKENVIYLSPDAGLVLEKIEAGKTYIIAGIVDKTLRNGLSLSRAQKLGVKAVCLPFKDLYPSGVKNNVLNIDTVVRLMIEFSKYQDWQKSFEEVLPMGKKLPVHLRQKNDSDAIGNSS
mmetsp:Transcript_35058/g.48807  ORF Transcript_35058/g.48807 Transcript_35058/m.48807 type:complete len:329 (-) Transcript_35058:134-1120(-)